MTAMSLTIPERLASLDRAHAAGAIIREAWEEGAELACLLSWYSPEARDAKDAAACPADALPPWLAYLTVWLDDAPSDTAWPGLIARYVRVLHRLHELAPDRLVRLDYECRAIAVRESRSHTNRPSVLAAIDGVLALLDRAAAGGAVQRMEWKAAEKAAAGAAWVAAKAAAGAAGAAARDAAARAAAEAVDAWAAAEAMAAWTAAAGAEGAEAAWAAVWAAAARSAADRMADAMLAALENAITEKQESSPC
jgi:hypothetical protein